MNLYSIIWSSLVCGTISLHDIECPLFTSYITRWPFPIIVGATSVDRFCIPSYMCTCIGVSTSMVVKRGKRAIIIVCPERQLAYWVTAHSTTNLFIYSHRLWWLFINHHGSFLLWGKRDMNKRGEMFAIDPYQYTGYPCKQYLI